MNYIKCLVPLKRQILLKPNLSTILLPSAKYASATSRSVVKKNQFPNPDLTEDKQIGGIGWFLLLIPIATFTLGTWQVKRKKWKEDLIEKLMIKTREPPVPLPENDNEVEALDFRKVKVSGEFDHSQEMFLGPRSCLIDGESTYSGKLMSTAANNSSGYLVVTPFILSDTKEKILVNRGWIPFSHKKAITRSQGQIQGEVELIGVVRTTEPKPSFVPLNKMDARVWLIRDVEKMAEVVDTRPVFIDATVESTVHGGPIGGQTRASLRNEHFSYILTWYSLSAATGIMWYFRFFKKTVF